MNRYIKAMEIGLANEENGISYFDLVYGLHGTKEKVFAREAEITFFFWFVDNFSHAGTYSTYYRTRGIDFRDSLVLNENRGTYHQEAGERNCIHNELNEKWFLNGTAAKQYLDYLELQESRITANNAQIASIEANKKAATSIKLAIGAIFASLLLGLYSIYSSPEPPYDVKIIEDTTRAIELEKVNEGLKKKNDSLSKELFKAEMLIDTYEFDSIKKITNN